MAGLYIHIPLPREALSTESASLSIGARTALIDAIIREAQHIHHTYGQQTEIRTLTVEGSGIALLDNESLVRLIKALFETFELRDLEEMGISLPPFRIPESRIVTLDSLGFTFIQTHLISFYKRDYQPPFEYLEPDQIEALFSAVERAGFNKKGIKIAAGVPDQPIEYWNANFEKALNLNPDIIHLEDFRSLFEPRSPTFLHRMADLLEQREDLAAELEVTVSFAESKGYAMPLLGLFTRNGSILESAESFSNHESFLGIGPAAHSFFWTGKAVKPANRWSNVSHLDRYQALLKQGQLPLEKRSSVGLDTLINEYIMLRLDTRGGIDLALLESKYGADLLMEKLELLAALEAQGWIDRIKNNAIRISIQSKKHTNDVVSSLLLTD